MRIVGLDLSLTATGVAPSDGAPFLVKPKSKGHERLKYIVAIIDATTRLQSTDLVVIEGPSYGSTGSAYHQIAGLWWVVAHYLWTAEIPYAVVSPQARAKYATGKGNAGKDAVLSAVVRRFPNLDVNDNNAADAVVLMAMGCDKAGHPPVEMPATHREALAKVEWPTGFPDGPGGVNRNACGVPAQDRASLHDSGAGADRGASAHGPRPVEGGA